jgi:hypothetical protein
MVAVATGDAIPLLDDNGSGQYIKGRNNAHDIRAGLIGALFTTDATAVTYKGGVIARGVPGGGGISDLQVQQNGGGGQNVIVKLGRAIIPRTGQGPYLWTSEADQVLAMPAASGAGTRIDAVCVTAYDKGPFPADAAHGPELTVVSGTVGGGSPTIPTGSLVLAFVTRAANDNVISTAEITDVRQTTTLTGGVWYWGPGDIAVNPNGTFVGQYRDTGSTLDRWTGAAWENVANYFGTATGGHAAYFQPSTSPQAIPTATDTKVRFDTAETPDASVTASGTNNTNFLINKSGVWDITFSGRQNVLTATQWLFYLAPSGSSAAAGRLAAASSGSGVGTGSFPAAAFSRKKRIAAGTSLAIYAYHEAGTSQSLNPEGSELCVQFTWLRA